MTDTTPVPAASAPCEALSTAEAFALNVQAMGLTAELNRVQRLHPDVSDPRLDDALRGAELLTYALGHLALGTAYPEADAAREQWLARRGAAIHVPDVDLPVHLVPGDPA